MWRYNIIGDNKVSISHLLRLDPMTERSILLTDNLVALKKENYEPILIVKIIEWRKFIDFLVEVLRPTHPNLAKITYTLSASHL